MAKYLDYTGLSHYDEKIKGVINTEADARKAADSDIIKKFADYLLKTGGVISGDLTIQQNLTVQGTTKTENTETLNVKDAIVVTNSEGADISATLAGFVIRLNATDCYGIIYDKSSDSVKLGLGKITDGKFAFNTGEGEAVATRADSTALTNGHLIQWDGTNLKFVDAQVTVEQLISTDAALDSAIQKTKSDLAALTTKVTTVEGTANAAQSAANAAQGTADNALSEAGTKLDKLTGTISAYDVAYIKKGGTEGQGWVAITPDLEGNTLAKRDSSGKLKVAAGTAGAEAVNYIQLAAVDTKADTAQATAEQATSEARSAQSMAAAKQDELVSGQNIKTINGQSVLGSGDVTITVPEVQSITNTEIDALFA